MTEEERRAIDAVLYYESIGAKWCFILKQMRPYTERQLKHLLALHRKEQRNGRTTLDR